MIKILVTGANGQLGSEIRKLSPAFSGMTFTFVDIGELDLSDTGKVSDFFEARSFDYVVNCAAYTAVDKAESDADNAFRINSEIVGHLAKLTRSAGARMIHISTDYVFDGNAHTPYREDSQTNPLSLYGLSKLQGEKLLLENNPDSIIIRTAWLYSSFGNNFVKTMLRLGKERDELRVVSDQIGSPTNAADLANAVLTIIRKVEMENYEFVPGIYHYTNEGVASWYDFAFHIFDITKTGCKVKPIASKEYPTPAPRPFYSVLNKQKIKETYDIDIPHWYQSLKSIL